MVQLKSIWQYHNENSVDLTKQFCWILSIKKKMIINSISTGITSRESVVKQEYQKHNNTMFYKPNIVSACADVAGMLRNYYEHKKRDPNTKIPHPKNTL